MGKLLAKVKSTFFTQTPSIDNGLFEAPDPLPSSKLPARYHPEDRPSKSRPAKVVNSTDPHRIKISGARHMLSSSSLDTDDLVSRGCSHSFDSYEAIPRWRSRRRERSPHSPVRFAFGPFPRSRSRRRERSPHSPVSSALGPFPLRSANKDYENQRPGVHQVRSRVKEHASVSGVDNYHRVFSPSCPPGWRHVSAPTTISHGTSTSAHIPPQASPTSQSSFHQRGNDNLAGQAQNPNKDPYVINRPHRLNQRVVSAPITFDSLSRHPTTRYASPVASYPLNVSKQRGVQNRDITIGFVGQPSLPVNTTSQRHVSAPNSTPFFADAQFARLHPSSPGSLNTQRRSAHGPAAQPELRDKAILKACNICFDSHPPTEFPARPITSTCTHPIDNTCKNCLQQHLATQIASRGGAVLTCICNQPLSFDDVQRHATTADFGRYSERAALGTVERYANFVWCPRTGCSGGQIHEAGEAEPIVTCTGCHQRYCYTHRVSWHAGVTCTQYDALTPDEQVEAIERAEASASATLPPTSAVDRQSPQMPNFTEQAERRRRRAEERAGEDFVRASGAKACPQCCYMTEKDGGCIVSNRLLMSTSTVSETPLTTKLELRTAYGVTYRDVLNKPPRDCTADEIPVIDLSPLSSRNLGDRLALAYEIKAASVNTGFFYVKNHGIPQQTIDNAKMQLLSFFHQPTGYKERISQEKSQYFNGWRGPRATHISPTEGVDVRESMSWRYSPQYDPDPKLLDAVPEEVKPWLRGEEFVWEGTEHLPGFKKECLAYWSACLTLARKLVKVFALSLDLPEDYFDTKTTYPGADGVFNYYPLTTAQEVLDNAIGLGSHTDLQLFTLLWQDTVGGLQVLNADGQWIKAPPVEGTLVVNIGDFMMRLSNDTFKSTVHRVYNRAKVERVSMPFFFGLNFNCIEGVVPTCTSEANPPKYEPISCGDWCQLRFQREAAPLERVSSAQVNGPVPA